ncbi:hypothetical protein KUTeg_000647 [Tegillarca granosa]|uniref:VWFA and cache domain-containing protein 1 n=1 Tax=Tegillarca granosa TaxID=220873 RepID=A0ABQ9FY53_TEGGR|nr:hypothetical protein KUTeg_000647 [Tegillarca granosa]
MFLTDGEPTVGANPLGVIRDENGILNNSVVIFTYGLGSQLSKSAVQLLTNMSLQTINDPTKGPTKTVPSEHIKDPSTLVSKMSSYYNSLIIGTSEATFTVPYNDAFSKIGLLTSICLPAFDGSNFIGVVCIDMKISDLRYEMSVMIESDEKSYSFLIDGYGHTLVHPLLPLPWSVTDDVILLDISHFETSLNTSAIDQMKRGQNGTVPLKNTRTLPRGKVLYEGITTNIVSSHYYWKKVENTNYTVCVVIGGSGIKHLLGKQSGRDGIFSYHVTSLSSDKLNRCRHFARYATKDKSLIMLTPSAFKEPYKYLDSPETEVTVTKYENYFSGKTTTDDTFKDSVLRSMVVTSNAEPLWKSSQEEASYVIWRYIATVDGIVRMYPGVEIKKDYDPKLRPWYWRTIAEKGKMVLSAPYKDAWGSGYLITLSKTIFEGRSDNLPTNPSEKTVAAVMGTDFPIYFFYRLLLEQYPICNNTEYSCFVIDTSGFIVIHEDFTMVYTDPKLDDLYHITNREGKIARDLMSKGILTKRTCTDFQSVQDQVTYRVYSTSFYKDGVDTLSSGDPGYELRPIKNTNIFLIIKKRSSDKLPCCQRQISPSLFQCTSEPSVCECLCYRKIPFDYCRNKYASSDASPLCSAPAPKYDSVFQKEEEKIKSLNSCFETKCDIRDNVELCYKVAGCSWCVESASGYKTKPPFCALKEICPFGKCEEDSNCNTNSKQTSNQEGLNTTSIIGIAVGCGVGLILIILIVIVIVRRRANKPQDDYITPVSDDHRNVGIPGGPYGFPVYERCGQDNPMPISQNLSTDLDKGYTKVDKEMTEIAKPPQDSIQHIDTSDKPGEYYRVTHML